MNKNKGISYVIRYRLLAALVISICCLCTHPYSVMAAQPEDAEIYGIGSVSKMFGAAAVMLLVDRGMVELDAPVTDYIPEFEMEDVR